MLRSEIPGSAAVPQAVEAALSMSIMQCVGAYPDDDPAVVILTNLRGASPEFFVDRIAAAYLSGHGDGPTPAE